MPYLKKFGVTPEQLVYTFDFRGSFYLPVDRQVRLSVAVALGRGSTRYEEQMIQMPQWLDEAKANGIKKAFIVFHYPVFARSGLGPIPEPDNPHKVIAAYAKDMEVIVFNGHVHTTELYDVDGVKYLMLGGGGAEQNPILPGQTSPQGLACGLSAGPLLEGPAAQGGLQLRPR